MFLLRFIDRTFFMVTALVAVLALLLAAPPLGSAQEQAAGEEDLLSVNKDARCARLLRGNRAALFVEVCRDYPAVKKERIIYKPLGNREQARIRRLLARVDAKASQFNADSIPGLSINRTRLAQIRSAAAMGTATAQYQLGWLYHNGWLKSNRLIATSSRKIFRAEVEHLSPFSYRRKLVSPQTSAANYTEALNWYRKAAEQNYVQAYTALGFMYEHGQGVRKNEKEAIRFYWEGATLGEATAQYNLALLLDRTGINPKRLGIKDKSLATQSEIIGVTLAKTASIRWYVSAVQQFVPDAILALGLKLENGEGIRRNLSSAALMYQLAADQGNADAQWRLAWMYDQGRGVEVNSAKATRLMVKPALLGYPQALFRVAQGMYSGVGANPDGEAALQLFKTDLAHGNNRGLLAVGYVYAQSPRTAQYLDLFYQPAAVAGEKDAFTNLGYVNHLQLVPNSSLGNARKFYDLAIKEGSEQAQYNSATLLVEEEKLSDAAKSFRKLANQGNPFAQFNIGYMYSVGEGVKESSKDALYWMGLARKNYEQSDPIGFRINRSYRFLASTFTPKELERIEKRVKRWKPKRKK